MKGSITNKFKKRNNQINSLHNNSSENPIELYHNTNDSQSGKQFFNTPREEETEYNTTFQLKEENFKNKNVLIDDKPTFNINTLQSIRIVHSNENTKNSQTLIFYLLIKYYIILYIILS